MVGPLKHHSQFPNLPTDSQQSNPPSPPSSPAPLPPTTPKPPKPKNPLPPAPNRGNGSPPPMTLQPTTSAKSASSPPSPSSSAPPSSGLAASRLSPGSTTNYRRGCWMAFFGPHRLWAGQGLSFPGMSFVCSSLGYRMGWGEKLTGKRLLFMLETQPKWYIPAPRVLGWHIGFWNLVGAFGFTVRPSPLSPSYFPFHFPSLHPSTYSTFNTTTALRCPRPRLRKLRRSIRSLPCHVLGQLGVSDRELDSVV